MSYRGKRQGYYGRKRSRGATSHGFRKKKKIEAKPVTYEYERETKGFLNIPTGKEKEKMTVSQPLTSFEKGDASSFTVKVGNRAVNAGISDYKENKTRIKFAKTRKKKPFA